ncbi:NAD(P)/FAD-dependent oxidoreductase [Acetobacter sp.]|uniref:NAD(P)/FAD-dependent oxidoreductase n=1 Tax=Acetobacter sp. TaxID=440 RepID=UPI0039EA6239
MSNMTEEKPHLVRQAPQLPAGASVVVIGAGVTGLSAAWWLARDGVDVVVIDKGIVGAEASSRNGGGATHYQSPLFLEEQRLWPMMDDLLGYPTEYRPDRIIFATNPIHLRSYARIAENIRNLGFKVTDLDSKVVRELVPLAGRDNLGGIYVHTGGQANPQRTVQAYAWAAQDLGARIFQHMPALRIETAGGRAVSVVTPSGTIGCDHVVIAAGPQSEALARDVGLFMPLAAARAEMIVTEAVPLMKIGGVDGNGLYGRQTLRGNLAYGGGWHEWLPEQPLTGKVSRPSTPTVQHLALRVAQLFPGAAHLRVIRAWAGIVENTPDGRPVLDRPTGPGNVTVASMSGVGFGLSPAVGHALRDLVTEGRCTFTDIDKLCLSRFATLRPDWRSEKGWFTPATVTA